MKKIIFSLLILLMSCHQRYDKNEIKFTGIEIKMSDSTNFIKIETEEKFYEINKARSFGFECAINQSDFEKLSREKLNNELIIFDVVEINKTDKNHYRFSIDDVTLRKLKEHECLYCRFTRPDFFFTQSYKSNIFQIEVKNMILH